MIVVAHGIAKLVGMGEVVLGGRERSAEGGEGTGVEASGKRSAQSA